ncbi:putative Serine/threonine protein kinase [Tripterygium wilfordii]|uniref:Putative Serine/threonine protein kinase n=1 Tax=Tripterygium wilfordii TaxID=458696 RepID=A0A7J7DEV4_TRIWF|nr:putative Serine/threonine protein kinase [Tripterygium wilfordii]
MDASPSTSEIVESTEELDFEARRGGKAKMKFMPKSGKKTYIEDDINRLFGAIDVKTSAGACSLSHAGGGDALRKSLMKRPMRVGSSQALGIGVSEPVSLKQALRGLCISQASELAATKRLLRPAGASGIPESGTIKRFYRAVVVEDNGSVSHLTQGKANLVEISLVPERITFDSSEKRFGPMEVPKAELSNLSSHPSDPLVESDTVVSTAHGVGFSRPNILLCYYQRPGLVVWTRFFMRPSSSSPGSLNASGRCYSFASSLTAYRAVKCF